MSGVAPAATKITIGNVPSLTGGPLFIGIEKGYYAKAGLEIEIHNVASSAEAAALLATGRLQVVSGAVSVGFFNSLEQGLPTKLILSRASTPVFHNLILRTDLVGTLKTAADLKGRTIGSNARGAVTTYEVGKIVESGGLTLKDVEIKFMGFPQMPVALANKAVDAAIMIPPLVDVTVARGLAVKWISPEDVIKALPLVIAVKQINTEWAAKNEKAMYDFVLATMQGVREYCDAYHRGSNRAEMIDALAKPGNSGVTDKDAIAKMEWGSRDPDGRVFEASVMDIQDFYLKEGLTSKKFALADLVDDRYRKAAVEKLGPYKIAHDDGKPGCR